MEVESSGRAEQQTTVVCSRDCSIGSSEHSAFRRYSRLATEGCSVASSLADSTRCHEDSVGCVVNRHGTHFCVADWPKIQRPPLLGFAPTTAPPVAPITVLSKPKLVNETLHWLTTPASYNQHLVEVGHFGNDFFQRHIGKEVSLIHYVLVFLTWPQLLHLPALLLNDTSQADNRDTPSSQGPAKNSATTYQRKLDKIRRERTTFTNEQTTFLEHEFQANGYVSRTKRIQLSEKLELAEGQVKIWFQNRRAKEKRIEKAHLSQHQLRFVEVLTESLSSIAASSNARV